MNGGKISPATALWLLITVALVIFVGFSLSDREINLANHSLKKASFAETLTAASALSEALEDTVAQHPDTLLLAEKEIIVEPDTTVHSVLVFGDSMTHHLAMSVAKYGTRNNYKVTGVTWESSSIPAWCNSGKIKEYLDMSKPDFVIVSLGSNEMELRNFDRRVPYIKKIVEQIDSIPFVWVGPPLWKEDKGVYAMLKGALPEGVLFKTEGIDIQRGPDHIHPTRKGADVWADTIMSWIRTTHHPIPAEKPDSGTSTRGHKFIYLHPDD